jgi:hypothetical protein
LDLLRNRLEDLLEDVLLIVRRDMWYLLDGAPPHYAIIVRVWLDENFPDEWIGRNGSIPLPLRSRDLIRCDFFVWGHMKQLVYAEPVNSEEDAA